MKGIDPALMKIILIAGASVLLYMGITQIGIINMITMNGWILIAIAGFLFYKGWKNGRK